ncbi:MAG: aromatic ring-hydroxylating dioxygenase subunit alpha [Gammaproteobacteria bacterium]|nr:aromatic ring-hydroxylating dioxygenase subunit alpha [Gammaproteobacteria bacterium]
MNKMHDPDLGNCVKPAEAAASIPPVYYTSDSVASDEVETVFRRGWIGVGRADMVRAPGDFITLDFAGQSIILLRDKTGQLRAFANSCRHRGARLVDGTGSCKGLRCPFHSWFYGLDGKLVAAPHMERAHDFDKADNGLLSYRAEERLGFAFVSLSPNAPELDAYLGDFAELHAPWPMGQLVTVRRQEVEVDCNWKIFLEVFNEYYHLPFVHADSIDSVYDKPDAPDVVTGAYASQFGATEGTGGLLEADQDKSLPEIPGLTGKARKGARYTWIFPNMTFAANRDALWCYEAYPLGASKCRVVQTSCFPPETIALPDFEKKSAAYLKRMDAALDEDIEALVNQQKGLACPDARPGRFQPDLEPNVAAFARWYSGVWV